MGDNLTVRAACATVVGSAPFFVTRFLATVRLGNLPVRVPYFSRLLVALMYRMRGAGPTPPGTEYASATIPLAGRVF